MGHAHPARRWGLIALVLGVALFVLLRQERQGSIDGSSAAHDNLAVYSTETTSLDGPVVPSTVKLAPEQTREVSLASPDAALMGIVRSSLGEPIVNAEVELVWLTGEDREWELAWHGGEWGALERVRQKTESGPDGGFSLLLTPPEGALGAVVSATHAAFAAGLLVLPVERERWPAPVELLLDPASPMKCLVLDAQGRPAAGASVEQYGTTPRSAEMGEGGVSSERARRTLLRSHVTGPDGRVELGPFPGVNAFVARRGAEASLPWSGAWQGQVTLRLLPTFEVGGDVSLPSWEHLNYVGERRMTIAVQSRNLWRELKTIRSVNDGLWGPVSLPLVDADRYRVRLEGSPIIPEEWFFSPPTAGARLRHDFAPTLGHTVWFRITDEQGRVIPTAVVKVRWQDPTNREHWNFVERSQNGSGQIEVWSLPLGSFKFTASAPGYVPYHSSLLPVARYEKGHAAVTLLDAVRVRGNCTYRGKPVEDFEILFWNPAEYGRTTTRSFFGREDGSFELDEAPGGSFWITASSSLSPVCEPVEVQCAPGATAEVTLELLDGIMGKGRVVDRSTGAPVQDAAVHLFVKGGIAPVARWGLPVPVRSDGTFELAGFLPGESHIRVLAPGYSDLFSSREVTSGRTLDWGDLALVRAQELKLVLEPPERATGASVLVSGSADLPGIDFEQGVALYPNVSEGQYALYISELGDIETFKEVTLQPGGDWTVRTPIAGPNRLSVQVVPDKGTVASRVWMIDASYLSQQGHRTVRTKFQRGDGPVEFEGIDGPSVTVQVVEFDGKTTSARGSFQDGELHLDVPLGDESFLLRVVDEQGEPIPGVRVIVNDPETPALNVFGSTDAQGLCPLQGIPKREIVVNLQHGSKGSHFGIPVDASTRKAELVLDGRARLDLQFLDGELPLSGVTCNIVDADGSAFLQGPVSDDQGRATILGLGADTYQLKATRADCWPADFFAEARIEGAPSPVQVRRLADLELEIHAQGGLPVFDLAVELTSLEFEADVAGWIAAERVRSEGLRTDIHGRIRVEGLPRGAYRWRAVTAATPSEGVLEIGPGDSDPIRVVLP
jgi:hypothetical protein